MLKRLGVVLSAVGLLAAGCAQEGGGTGGEAITVVVDGKTDAFAGAFTAFFPKELSVHAGSTVKFDMPQISGEPHTITLGTLIDAAVKKLEQLGPTASLNDMEESSEMLHVVDPFFHEPPPPGPPKLNQSGALPCFLASGNPPGVVDTGKQPWLTGGSSACDEQEQPDFDGTQSFYNSGAIFNEGDSFSVDLADDIKPGTYSFMCLVHRAAMTGKLEVVGDDQDVPSASEVRQAGRKQFDELVGKLQPAVDAVKNATAEKPVAGAGVPEAGEALVAEFGPSELSIPVGGTVAWNVFFFHTIAFNPTAEDIGIFQKAPDGSIVLNAKAAPTNSTPPPAINNFFPPPRDAKPFTVNGGPWDGASFRSSGLLAAVPPMLITYSTTFTKAGTYRFQCQLHPDMKGQVRVG
jgi:plastocyanin